MQRQEDSEEDRRDEQHRHDGDEHFLFVRERVLAPLRIGEAALAHFREPEIALDLLLHPFVGEDVGAVFRKHLFDVLFHMPSSSSSFALSFFRASLFFHVTVESGMPSISATSLLL